MNGDDRLKLKARELRDLMDRIDQVTALLEGLNDKRKAIERTVLPDMFAEAGLKSVRLEDGSVITLSILAEGSLPKDPAKRAEAIAWLAANGYAELIENKVTSSWTRGDRDKAQAEYERLAARGDAKVTLDEGIHPMTLGARMRDRIVAGEPTPLDLLGVTVFPRARFTKRTETESTANDNGQQ